MSDEILGDALTPNPLGEITTPAEELEKKTEEPKKEEGNELSETLKGLQEVIKKASEKPKEEEDEESESEPEVDQLKEKKDEIKSELDKLDFEDLTSKDLALLNAKVTENLLKAGLGQVEEKVQQMAMSFEVQLARATNPDFDDLLDGPEGVRELVKVMPNAPLQKIVAMARKLKKASDSKEEEKQEEKKPTRSFGGEKPSGESGQPKPKAGEKGDLSLDAAVLAAMKELGL